MTKERAFSWAVPLLLAAVLICLAFLQYRWSAQVGDATNHRMKAGLQTSLMYLREDLERELASMALDLQSEPDKPTDAQALNDRIHLWETNSGLAGMVASVYLWNGEELQQLSMQESKFAARDWPARFEGLRPPI